MHPRKSALLTVLLALMFCAEVVHAQSSPPVFFSNSAGYLVWGSGRGLVAADLTGDGIPDLGVTVQCDDAPGCYFDSVSVYSGRGNGRFKYLPGWWRPLGFPGPRSLVADDFNEDGLKDVSVAQDSGEVAVLIGRGRGFQFPVTYSTGNTGCLIPGDFDGDRHTDLIQCGSGIGFLKGNGDGTFLLVPDSATGQDGLAAADFNGDGILDLAGIESCYRPAGGDACAGYVNVLMGNGDGTFHARTRLLTGVLLPSSIVTGDFNGDGKTDVAVLESRREHGKSWVTMFLGDGDGALQPGASFFAGGYDADSLVSADFNADGIPDVAVAMSCTTFSECPHAVVGILLGNGDGTLGRPLTFRSTYDSVGRPEAMVASDFDADGYPDIAVVSGPRYGSWGSFISVFMNLPGHVTSTSLAASANPVLAKQAVTYTATLRAANGRVPRDGSVTFKQGKTDLQTVPLMKGRATFTTTYETPGTRWITAEYSGVRDFSSSTSAVLHEIVQKIPTVITVASSRNPSTVGHYVTLRARFNPSVATPPDGEIVTFYDGASIIGTGAVVSGLATLEMATLSAGTHIIRAAYGGDAVYEASSSGSFGQVVIGETE